jgi:hypothetical protein
MLRSIFAIGVASAASLCARTEQTIQRSIPAPSTTRLVLNARNGGSINAIPGPTGTILIEVRFKSDRATRAELDRIVRDFSLDVDRFGPEVHVTGRSKSGQPNWSLWSFLFNGFGSPEIEYRVELPAQSNANLRTSGGSISVSGLGGDVEARTSGGSLHLVRIAGSVDGSTSGGNVSLEDSHGKATLRTSGGSIDVEGALNALDAATSGGNIRIGLAPGKGFDIDARTSGGSVSCDFPVPGYREHRESELHGSVAGGGPLLHLRTSGGNIHVGGVGSTRAALAN